VTALQSLSPRGLYVPAYVGDLATVLLRLSESKIRPIVLGTSSAAPDLIRRVGTAGENLVFPLPSFDPTADSAAVRAFVHAFVARYSAEPDIYAAHAYDAVNLLAAAAARARSWDAAKLKDALVRIDNYEGATGRLAFDRNGDVVQYPRLYVVRDGQFVAYDRFVEAGGALPVPGR
jgi:branched-chain amino acid transport system substrate-binding protein